VTKETAMKTHFQPLTTLLLLCTLLLLSACAHQVPTRSGFINDYRDLKSLEGDANLQVTPIVDRWDFAAIEVAPVQFISDGQNTRVADADQAALCRSMEQALSQEFSTLSSKNAEQSKHLQIKAAITSVDRSRPILNLITTLALFVPLDNGGVSVEIEAVDEETGRRIAAMSGARNGSIFAMSRYFKSYGHAEAGLRELAHEFRKMFSANQLERSPGSTKII